MNQSASFPRDDDDLSVCRISPWNNKDEFCLVYQLLFGPDVTVASKQQACEYLRMWKIRRQYLTPASVLSTLTILEVQLQDVAGSSAANAEPTRRAVLRQLYAHALTRFLNYMSSILQSRQLKSMYVTASELGLGSFLVDLRHLCAHGHDLPALDVFQRAAVHLLDWLHGFYWQREREYISDARAADVRPSKAVDFEAYVESLLQVYDTATEAIYRRCRHLCDIKTGQTFADEQQAVSLKKYGIYHKLERLSVIAGRVINELTQLVAKESSVRGNDRIFCTVLLRCEFFVGTAAALAPPGKRTQQQQQRCNEVIATHQNLFRALAVCGFIETFFRALVSVCEDEHETVVRRRGSQFWANQVAGGFAVFKEVKRAFKARKERNVEFEMDLAPLNTDAMSPEIREVYKRLGVNCGGVLIFGDTIRRPWSLTFSRAYLNERAAALNEYTFDVLEKCMALVEPPLSAAESEQLRGLMALCGDAETVTDAVETTEELGAGKTTEEAKSAEITKPTSESALTVECVADALGSQESTKSIDIISQDQELDTDKSGPKTYGIWSEVSDDFNWKVVPLGRVPWEE